MSEPEFGIEVPEADRLEQLREDRAGVEPVERAQGDPPAFDTGEADPADVADQHREVPAADDEDY